MYRTWGRAWFRERWHQPRGAAAETTLLRESSLSRDLQTCRGGLGLTWVALVLEPFISDLWVRSLAHTTYHANLYTGGYLSHPRLVSEAQSAARRAGALTQRLCREETAQQQNRGRNRTCVGGKSVPFWTPWDLQEAHELLVQKPRGPILHLPRPEATATQTHCSIAHSRGQQLQDV